MLLINLEGKQVSSILGLRQLNQRSRLSGEISNIQEHILLKQITKVNNFGTRMLNLKHRVPRISSPGKIS